MAIAYKMIKESYYPVSDEAFSSVYESKYKNLKVGNPLNRKDTEYVRYRAIKESKEDLPYQVLNLEESDLLKIALSDSGEHSVYTHLYQYNFSENANMHSVLMVCGANGNLYSAYLLEGEIKSIDDIKKRQIVDRTTRV